MSPISLRRNAQIETNKAQKENPELASSKSNTSLLTPLSEMKIPSEDLKKIELNNERIKLIEEQQRLNLLLNQQEEILKQKQVSNFDLVWNWIQHPNKLDDLILKKNTFIKKFKEQILYQQNLHQERLEQLKKLRQFENETNYSEVQLQLKKSPVTATTGMEGIQHVLIQCPNEEQQEHSVPLNNLIIEKQPKDEMNLNIENLVEEVYKRLLIKKSNQSSNRNQSERMSSEKSDSSFEETSSIKQSNSNSLLDLIFENGNEKRFKSFKKQVYEAHNNFSTKLAKEKEKTKILSKSSRIECNAFNSNRKKDERSSEVDPNDEENRLIEDLFFI
jgi:hypothetical protein